MNSEEKKIYNLKKEILKLNYKLELLILDHYTSKITERSREVIQKYEQKVNIALEKLSKAKEELKLIDPSYEAEAKADDAASNAKKAKRLVEEISGKAGKYVGEAKKVIENYSNIFK